LHNDLHDLINGCTARNPSTNDAQTHSGADYFPFSDPDYFGTKFNLTPLSFALYELCIEQVSIAQDSESRNDRRHLHASRKLIVRICSELRLTGLRKTPVNPIRIRIPRIEHRGVDCFLPLK
jgi:hypothetical protein